VAKEGGGKILHLDNIDCNQEVVSSAGIVNLSWRNPTLCGTLAANDHQITTAFALRKTLNTL
jgi:hypothetical protein